jgi:MoxR-like ATPase
MSYPFYQGTGAAPPAGKGEVDLPKPERDQFMDPANYLADAGLRDACNVALLLGQPLLLTGEAGTGKTLFASSVAHELGLPRPYKFETKSTSTAQDLFYTYDALKRFQSQGDQSSALPYITYQALGKAMLFSNDPAQVQALLPPGLTHPGKTRSVVLIDEIDKAPRDFPNDMLNELELMYFRIPELDAIVRADPAKMPVVIITSNSEKDLPDAFLRRCVYYHIQFPEETRLREIIARRLGLNSAGSSVFLDVALEVFRLLRQPGSGLRKKPATAELLGWMFAMQQIAPNPNHPLEDPQIVLTTLSSLVKTADDQRTAEGLVKRWMASPRPASQTG